SLLRSSVPEQNTTLTSGLRAISDQHVPVRRRCTREVLLPHGQRLEAEPGRNGIDEGQPLGAAPSEPESAVDARIAGRALELGKLRGLEAGGGGVERLHSVPVREQANAQ